MKNSETVMGQTSLETHWLLPQHGLGSPLSFPVVPSQTGSGLQSPPLTPPLLVGTSLIP